MIVQSPRESVVDGEKRAVGLESSSDGCMRDGGSDCRLIKVSNRIGEVDGEDLVSFLPQLEPFDLIHGDRLFPPNNSKSLSRPSIEEASP